MNEQYPDLYEKHRICQVAAQRCFRIEVKRYLTGLGAMKFSADTYYGTLAIFELFGDGDGTKCLF